MRKYFPAHAAALLFIGIIVLAGCRREQPPVQTPLPADNTGQTTETTPHNPGIDDDYLNTNRVIWQKPDLILRQLGELKDKTVADIGAGTGFFSLRMAPLAKKVVAIDIDPRFVSHLDSLKAVELPADVQARLETRLAKPDDPNLRPGEADVIVIVNTYMYIKDRVGYLRNLKNGLSNGGRLLIVDFKKKRMPLGPPQEIRVPLFQAEDELYEVGYRDIATNDTSLDYQYIITARK